MCLGTRPQPEARPCCPTSDFLEQAFVVLDNAKVSSIAPTTSPRKAPSTETNASRKASFLSRSLASRTVSFVDSEVERLTSECKFMQEVRSMGLIAKLNRSEVILGDLLGQGGFSQVYEVSSISLESFAWEDSQQLKIRTKVRDSCGLNSNRYAMKHLRPDLNKSSTKRSTFHSAAADLVVEALFLSRIDHPNIIKLRGWAMGGTSCFAKGLHDDFFLLLDRLDETLTHRIARWEQEPAASDASICRCSCLPYYAEKVDIAVQISSALEYLHERRIVYRDLKADNVGLIQCNLVQLFDFGLARELPQSKFNADDLQQHNEPFHMSGVGTRRYCAPEIVLGEGYNLKVDVYSMSILLYEMMSHSKPFAVMGPESHRELVAVGGQRPDLPSSWPRSLQILLECGWAATLHARPTMKLFRQELQRLKTDHGAKKQFQSITGVSKMFRRRPDLLWLCPSVGSYIPRLLRKVIATGSCGPRTCNTVSTSIDET